MAVMADHRLWAENVPRDPASNSTLGKFLFAI